MGEEEEKKPGEGKEEAPEEAKKEEDKEKNEDGKEKKEGDEAPPSPPPMEVVMKVFMHCEGCARKVRRSLCGFEGVEEVTADYRIHRVVVKGKKAAEDPMKVVERVQRKSHRRVELISPIPPPKPEKAEEEEEEEPKVEEKKEEPRVIVVQLKVHMHCEACAKQTKKRILRMKGVQAAEPDLKSSTMTVTGVFDPARLAADVHKRTRKHAVVLTQELAEKKSEVAPVKANSAVGVEAKDNKKVNASEKVDEEEDGDGEWKDENKDAEGSVEEVKKEAGGGEGEEKEIGKKDSGTATDAAVVTVVATSAVDGGVGKMRRNEFYYYYPRYPVEYAYPPQIFSDENPNACTVM